MHTIDVIDSHTAGEPTRVVLSGFPDLGDGDLAQCRERFRNEFDQWRSAIACEPRGSDTMVGALLLPARDPSACTGVIFFNNVGYLGMCGHGTIGVVRTLAALGRIAPGQHRIETPVGTVGVELAEDGTVSVDNVESYRFATGVEVDVPGHGRVCGDVAWGGNWFFITEQAPCVLDLAHQRELTAYTEAIRLALEAAGITGEAGGEIDHIEVNGPAPDGSGLARNFVLCPGLAYDRSPCGTGTSAKLACLAADGKLGEGEHWVQQGILGSTFEGSYRLSGRGIAPRISGQAYITARSQLSIDPADPFAWGIVA
ncbi:proline racemase family protein [Xanthomonas hortorum]|uniref:4-hydroxyproline 2-epimerase n=1 Tax=Xanthomonas hortorum pv. pelargonii TaxID=453602 RepID=A0A6V7CSG8_9XANT|nr:proline racemase family protein [Xanthomonas hortorum]MCE4354234.1 proline racemase family protein [Xanthomonas hortorum pv. pelargonii]MCM5526184.1 proline racemase family protein [Xanthomonas hortorum pv. pelargonii]MCM5537866.1 proline racemase family protein [Xanthomonas hortorum pv. pelargonii]MCM5539588.1 proline racemase family protein [Xanthomonas hortorum pv. pelargonii]MCM5545508.1 proline racemase family protein [Xanthomonas hortorum pv. pelargonii]